MNDVTSLLCHIQQSPRELRQQVVDISKHSFRRSRIRDTIDRMRFVEIIQVANDHGTLQSTSSLFEKPKSLSSQPMCHILGSDQMQLRICHRSALRDASAYVAVSYCWNRDLDPASTKEGPSIDILLEDLSIRQSATPPDVMHRSITYAKAHGINAVWIDQECIDQNDPVDKEKSIQEMDMVYQESAHAVAVLEYHFANQAELDALSSVCGDDFTNFDPSQIEILEDVLVELSVDQWFERAWTLQESVSAGVSMTLLLGCPGLVKSSDFGPTSGEFEINIWDFQNAMVNVRGLVEEGLAAGLWADDDRYATNVSNCADVLWNYMPTSIPDHIIGTPLIRNPSHRQSCNASQALTFLHGRQNSVFQDRLAILANLCNYDTRIDTNVLALLNSSFTICVHALAILNGDMSLLGGYRGDDSDDSSGRSTWFMGLAEDARSDGRLVYTNDDTDLQSNTYGFSWGPKPSARLKDITYMEEGSDIFRLKPATLSIHGLRVRGVLWNVSIAVPVPKTQSLFASRWYEEIEHLKHDSSSEDQDRQILLVRELLWCLIHEVHSSGLIDLAKTLWNYSQPVGLDPRTKFEDLDAPLPYSFDMIFGQQQCDNNVRREAMNRLTVPDLWFDPENPVADRPPLERLLIDQLVDDGVLLCASPVDALGKAISVAQPYAWFEACKSGDQIYTPVTDLGDKLPFSRWRKQAVSWRVLQTGKSDGDGCNILHCLGRRRGIWRVGNLSHQDYVLE